MSLRVGFLERVDRRGGGSCARSWWVTSVCCVFAGMEAGTRRRRKRRLRTKALVKVKLSHLFTVFSRQFFLKVTKHAICIPTGRPSQTRFAGWPRLRLPSVASPMGILREPIRTFRINKSKPSPCVFRVRPSQLYRTLDLMKKREQKPHQL